MSVKTRKRVLVVNGFNAIFSLFQNRGYEVLQPFELKRRDVEPDLVCFTGGADVSPSLYGEEILPKTRIDTERDKVETKVFETYKNIPKVGICRGGQLLNVLSGGRLWQHVNNHSGSHKCINLVRIPNTALSMKEILVTSTHHQMMRAGEKGVVIGISVAGNADRGLATEYLTASEDKTHPRYDTEIVWYPETMSLCFQPHPEYNQASDCTNYFHGLIDHFFWK